MHGTRTWANTTPRRTLTFGTSLAYFLLVLVNQLLTGIGGNELPNAEEAFASVDHHA